MDINSQFYRQSLQWDLEPSWPLVVQCTYVDHSLFPALNNASEPRSVNFSPFYSPSNSALHVPKSP